MHNYSFEVLFWVCLLITFYTYLGYGGVLYVLVAFKRWLSKPIVKDPLIKEYPEITLFITAWNEEDMVDPKMQNTLNLDYPGDKLSIMWVTDGTTDSTNNLLKNYPQVSVQFRPERLGKTAAMNRGIKYVDTSLVVFTDANTMLNKDALKEIVRNFQDPAVGCVAGEKRILQKEKDKAVSSGEGFYWKYESKLKAWDSELNTVVGAAGELFAIRTKLYEEMPLDTLLDDFTLSLKIAQKGYKTAYNRNAYAVETSSADMKEEEKRKIRIAAGGIQSIWRLRSLLNIFRYKMLSFQYISHRVLRWTLTPVLLFLLLPLNVMIVFMRQEASIYTLFLILQTVFYLMAYWGRIMEKKNIRNKLLFIPYYFLFMNLCVFKGLVYLSKRRRSTGAWERARRG